jgi:Na+/proline symporter
MSSKNTFSPSKKVRTSRAAIIILIAIALGLAGPIAINIHELAHILCAVKGECFGEARWLEGISALPIWNLLFGTGAATLFVLSALGHFFVIPKVGQALSDSVSPDNMPSVEELKKATRLCMIISAIVWLTMLIASIWFYVNADI